MKKRIFTSFILICLLLAMPACAAGADQPAEDNAERLSVQSTGFTDVPADAWYAEAINYCQQNGIMSGTSATTFAPEATLTRAMLATVLHRMSGTPAVSDAPVFTDAVAGSWYSDAVSWAAKNSIISGYGGGTFGVNDPTTREQAVTILWRYAGEPEGAAAADISDAASVSAWAQTAVRWANANGILEGMTNNRRFGPKTNIKRGEVASMLYHYLSNTTSSQPGPAAGGETLVAYFSATNTTRPLAEYAADILGADLYEIVPEVPYTDADLAYYTNGRADREQNDSSARPAVSGSVANMADYDVIFLGYCLLLDDGEECICPQSITYSLICKWFRAAVLPLDAGLCAALLYRADRKKCVLCGGYYLPKSNRAKYCPECAEQERRRKTRDRVRRHRADM